MVIGLTSYVSVSKRIPVNCLSFNITFSYYQISNFSMSLEFNSIDELIVSSSLLDFKSKDCIYLLIVVISVEEILNEASCNEISSDWIP